MASRSGRMRVELEACRTVPIASTSMATTPPRSAGPSWEPPTTCRIYDVDSIFIPWNDQLAPQHSQAILSIDSGPNGRPCPGTHRPFSPRLEVFVHTPVAPDWITLVSP